MISVYGWDAVYGVVYKYRPLSLRALVNLLGYETGGEEALIRRSIDKSLWVMATGQRLDKENSECAAAKIREIYKNPFGEQKAREKSADDIVKEIIRGGRGKK